MTHAAPPLDPPAPLGQPWRTMQFNGMTPHIAGTTLSAQARPMYEEHLVGDGGNLAGSRAQP
ncbi:hypothetical protein [Streptomyces sp. NPDC005004]